MSFDEADWNLLLKLCYISWGQDVNAAMHSVDDF